MSNTRQDSSPSHLQHKKDEKNLDNILLLARVLTLDCKLRLTSTARHAHTCSPFLSAAGPVRYFFSLPSEL